MSSCAFIDMDNKAINNNNTFFILNGFMINNTLKYTNPRTPLRY